MLNNIIKYSNIEKEFTKTDGWQTDPKNREEVISYIWQVVAKNCNVRPDTKKIRLGDLFAIEYQANKAVLIHAFYQLSEGEDIKNIKTDQGIWTDESESKDYNEFIAIGPDKEMLTKIIENIKKYYEERGYIENKQ